MAVQIANIIFVIAVCRYLIVKLLCESSTALLLFTEKFLFSSLRGRNDVVFAAASSLRLGRRSGDSRRGGTPRHHSFRPRLGRNLHAGPFLFAVLNPWLMFCWDSSLLFGFMELHSVVLLVPLLKFELPKCLNKVSVEGNALSLSIGFWILGFHYASWIDRTFTLNG